MYRRPAWSWEAVTRGKAHTVNQVGIGQQYISTYKDSDDEFLVGSKH